MDMFREKVKQFFFNTVDIEARSVMIHAPSTNLPLDTPVPGLSQEKTAYSARRKRSMMGRYLPEL